MALSPGTLPGGTALDSPPPSPAAETGLNPGTSLGSLVPPIQSNQVPPEILTGILQSGESMSKSLDAFAQALPDLAPDFALAKDTLQRALSTVLMAGGGPTAPNAPGPNFPGGGFDRGGMPLASGGLG